MTSNAANDAERVSVPDRIVVSPRTGVFIPLEPRLSPRRGSTVWSGTLIGHGRCGDEMLQFTWPFEGVARDVPAWPHERVQYEPVLWMAAAN